MTTSQKGYVLRGETTAEQPQGHESQAAYRRREYATVAVGDAFDLAETLGDATVDCIVTSPPYWGLRSYGQFHDHDVLRYWADAHPTVNRKDLEKLAPGYDWYRSNGGALGMEPYPGWYVGHLVEFFHQLRNKLKAGGSLWVNLGDTYFARWSSVRNNGRQGLGSPERFRRITPSGGYLVDKQLLLIPSRFAISMQDSGWILRNDLIWSKPDTPPRPEKDRLKSSHEHFFHFVKRPTSGRAKYFYDLSRSEPGARDVVTVRPVRGRDGHSATFPEELIAPRIRTSTPPGGLVLDPFCGTGRTLECAVREGREAMGFEKSPEYAAAARRNMLKARASRLKVVGGPPGKNQPNE